jgi:hypothetical protein
MPTHDESRLPKWAQALIASIRFDAECLRSELERTQEAQVLLHQREWFAIHGPPPVVTDKEPGKVYRLWFLSNEGAHPACSLGKEDVMLVGRKKPDGTK